MKHTTVHFLPANTTSEMQPCDVVIIAKIKEKYRTFQLERAIHLANGETNNIYHVDILSAMFALKKIWNDL